MKEKKRDVKIVILGLKPRNLPRLGMMSRRCEKHEKSPGAVRRAAKMQMAKVMLGSTYQKMIFGMCSR